MTHTVKGILLACVFVLSSNVFAAGPKFDATRAFIKVTVGQELPQAKSIIKAKKLFGQNYVVTTTNVLDLEKELNGNSAIVLIERNYIADGKTLPKADKRKSQPEPLLNFGAFNDPLVGKVWAFLDSNKNGVSVNKSYLSPMGRNKEEIIVAVVDTGVDYNHEDLKSVMWINGGEIAGNGIDDDNNGYIDDVHGISTLDRDSDGNASGNPMASHAHGTHVSGTIAATQNNQIGIAGIASNVKIMAIRTVPDAADETDVDIVESFLYAAEHGASIINCSFGKSNNEGGMIVNETIDHIGQTYGTLVFAAAGNDYGRDIDVNKAYPASFPSDFLVVVASTTKRGKMSSFSNVGIKSVDIAAPGSAIYSTMPGNRYKSMSGTSMATPTSVGVAAEILSNFPSMSGLALKKILMSSVTKVRGFDKKMVSGGRVDLFKALQYTLENYNDLATK